MTGSVTLISDVKKKDEWMRVSVTLKDTSIKEYHCDYMGQSAEYPPLMVLLKENGEDVSPIAMINTDEVVFIDVQLEEKA